MSGGRPPTKTFLEYDSPTKPWKHVPLVVLLAVVNGLGVRELLTDEDSGGVSVRNKILMNLNSIKTSKVNFE